MLCHSDNPPSNGCCNNPMPLAAAAIVGIDKNKYLVEDEKGERLKRKLKPSEMIETKAPKLKTGGKVDKVVKESVVGRKNKRVGVDEDNIITKKRKPNMRITITGKRKVEWKDEEEQQEDRTVRRKVYATRGRKRMSEEQGSRKETLPSSQKKK
jgi:hypothetical protein